MLWFRGCSDRNRSCKHNQIGYAICDAMTGCASAIQVGCSTIDLARVFCLAVNRSIMDERCRRSYSANRVRLYLTTPGIQLVVTPSKELFPNRIEPISFIADLASQTACTTRTFALPQVIGSAEF